VRRGGVVKLWAVANFSYPFCSVRVVLAALRPSYLPCHLCCESVMMHKLLLIQSNSPRNESLLLC
jgi:hypothetical protein